MNKDDIVETLYVMFQLHTPDRLPHDSHTMKTIFDMAEKHSEELLSEVTNIYYDWVERYK